MEFQPIEPIKDITSHWTLRALYHGGLTLGLNADDKREWTKIESMYQSLERFEALCVALIVYGEADCNELLSVHEALQNGSLTALSRHSTVRGDGREPQLKALDDAISHIGAISERVSLILDFLRANLNENLLTYLDLQSIENGCLTAVHSQREHSDGIVYVGDIKVHEVRVEHSGETVPSATASKQMQFGGVNQFQVH